LKYGPTQRVDPGPGRPGVGTGPGWRKKKKGKTWCDPARPGQNSVAIRWLLFFLLKQRHFDFKKNWLGWPGQNLKPGSWTGPGLKTMLLPLIMMMIIKIEMKILILLMT
jgi:hypothetical protein